MSVRLRSLLLAATVSAGVAAAVPAAASAAPVAPNVLRADVQIHKFTVNKTGLNRRLQARRV
jgi:uncharacterized membrane protein